jgi:TonB-dependent SusC/RagA subfamily outer membrane receptor
MPLVIIDDRLPDSTRLASQGPIAITKNPMDVIKVLINPDDIGSITVLKDDAAVALYGDKGKDGVILITTRKTKEIRVKPLRE